MTHVHAWAPGIAPEYACLGCGAVGRRDPRSGRMRVTAEDAVEAEIHEEYRQAMAGGDLARREYRTVRPEPERTPAVDEQMEVTMGSRSNGSRIRRHAWTEADEAALEEADEAALAAAWDVTP